jgi:Skp family chaperone for outer membrane proteins
MKTISTLFILILVQLNCFSAELKIGIVDEKELMQKYEKSVFLIRKLEERYKKEETNMKELESKIIAVKKELMLAGTSTKERLMSQMRRLEVEYKVNKEYLNELLGMKRNEYTAEVLKDIHKAIGIYSKDNKYDLVMRKYIHDSTGEQNQMLVFYNREKMDITNDILNMINLKFKQSNK